MCFYETKILSSFYILCYRMKGHIMLASVLNTNAILVHIKVCPDFSLILRSQFIHYKQCSDIQVIFKLSQSNAKYISFTQSVTYNLCVFTM
jgi:hypothetical protein